MWTTLLSWLPLLAHSPPDRSPSRPQLHLNGLTFRTAIFSDLHFGENENSFGIPQDTNTTTLTDYVLELERPDFAIFNGDLITGENTFAHNSTNYVDTIVQPLVQRGIPWASTYGNHDSKYNLTRANILQAEQKYRGLALTQHGPEKQTDGVTNYVLPVYADDSYFPDDGKPVALLYFFDSRGGSQGRVDNGDNIPNWVSSRTAAWFRRTSAAARKKWDILPSFAFVHIPMRAFFELQQDVKANVSGSRYPGLNADVPLAQQGAGPESEAFMRALLDTPGLHSIYSGHDHGDSWCGRWPETTLPGKTASRPFLCFCKHSGFGGYGTWNRGVRMLEFSFDYTGGMEVKTWVRMQQGEVVTAVTLNETYGQDRYPTADGGYHPY